MYFFPTEQSVPTVSNRMPSRFVPWPVLKLRSDWRTLCNKHPFRLAASAISGMSSRRKCSPLAISRPASNAATILPIQCSGSLPPAITTPIISVFAPAAAVPLVAALMFALYALLTRYAARKDSAATSFFWTGTVGCLVTTIIGIGYWQPMSTPDWGWMATLCLTGASGHWLLIKTYEVAEASAVQPFAYLQLVFASAIGIFVFAEGLETHVAVGATIVVAAGLFTVLRSRRH